MNVSFDFPLPNGLHARPASHLQELASRFQGNIRFLNERGRREADAKSVLSLVATDVKQGDPCRIIFSGPDASVAREAFAAFLAGEFLQCDEPLPPVQARSGEIFLPRSLRKANPENALQGTVLCGGIGWGKAVFLDELRLPPALRSEIATEPIVELEKFHLAIKTVSTELGEAIRQSSNVSERTVLQAHRSILKDPTLADKVRKSIASDSRTAGQAIVTAGEYFSTTLRQVDSLYLRERALDVTDICHRLLMAVYGSKAVTEAVPLDGPSVCIAPHLTPGQFLALDRRHLQALVLGDAGTTSHTVILARSFGIPTLGGAADTAWLLTPGEEVIVDANCGIVIPRISETVARHYWREQRAAQLLQERWKAFQHQPAATSDGQRVEVGANVASAEEAVRAFESGAEGIGLFRTEMLFADRAVAPGEDEQTAIYSAVAKAAAGRPVIIRLFDIGGDKPVPYLDLPPEKNPFLGHRGVRLYADFDALIRIQLRAILRATEHGPLKIMVPMVSRVEEMQKVRALLATVRAELAAENISCAQVVELGAMLEIPSVAFAMPELCRKADFFSIGTNDLTQYFFAVDRDNTKVAPLYTPAHPAFLRLLRQLVEQAHARGRWIGVCGEIGEATTLLPLLIGLGLDEISVSVPRLGATKTAIVQSCAANCRALWEEVLNSEEAVDVELLIKNFGTSRAAALLTPEMVVINSDARTKEEAIREMVQTLRLNGRTQKTDLLEEQIWMREETYSTGFGGGFAIPHCQSEHLAANSLVVLKTRAEIEWGSLDGKPVQNIIMLAIRKDQQGKEHLKLLAKLSRLLMGEEFQDQVSGQTNAKSLADFILASL